MDLRQQFQRIAELSLIQNTKEAISKLYPASFDDGDFLNSTCVDSQLFSFQRQNHVTREKDEETASLEEFSQSYWESSSNLLECSASSDLGKIFNDENCLKDFQILDVPDSKLDGRLIPQDNSCSLPSFIKDDSVPIAQDSLSKIFKCPYDRCLKRFKQKSGLDYHVKMHRNQRDFECVHCSAKFFSRQHLQTHAATHYKEKPHLCTICNKRFQTAQNLRSHIRVHTGEKPFMCTHSGCNKAFAEKSTLVKHLASHSGLKEYKCKICQRCFSQSSSLSYHRRTKHSATIDSAQVVRSTVNEQKN